MIDLAHVLFLFAFASAFTFSDIVFGSMDGAVFVAWALLAVLLNVGLGMSVGSVAFSVLLAVAIAFSGDMLNKYTKWIGAGDLYFVAVASILFPFPVFSVYWMPVGMVGFILAGFAQTIGRYLTLIQEKAVAGISGKEVKVSSMNLRFAPFLFAGLALAVIMMM